MIKSIPLSDINVRPFKVYKQWSLDSSDIPAMFGTENTGSILDITPDPTNAGYSKDIIYASIKTNYYAGQSTASALFEIGKRKSYASDEREIESNIGVLIIPQIMYGESVKEGSVILTDDTGTLTDDSYSNLVNGSGDIMGNVFYNNGVIVLTKNVVSGSTLSNFDLKFKSTKTIYENEIYISVLPNEFNYSTNKTAVDVIADTPFVKWNTITSSYNPNVTGGFGDYEKYSKSDPTGSYLAPFITTIGLYDDSLNMVAVAKLPQPIKSLSDYPVNFIIRFDT
jgi:hypothetical protein